MRNLIIGILLMIGFVLNGQTYQQVNIYIQDSMKLGTSTNSVWQDTIKAGSIIGTIDGTDFVMDGIPWDIPAAYDTSNFYMDATLGSDANSGTNPDTAWQTITHVEQYADSPGFDPGDSIFFKRGETWEMDSVWQIITSGDATGDIVYDGDSWGVGDPATIKSTQAGAGSGIGFSIVRLVTCSYITFQNFIIDGDNLDGKHGIMVGGDNTSHGNPDQNDEHHITIQDCEVKDMGDADYAIGILSQPVDDTIRFLTIKDNDIHGINAHGISLYVLRHGYDGANRNILVSGNYIYDYHRFTGLAGVGIHVNNSNDTVTVEYNTIIESNDRAHGIVVERNDNNPGHDFDSLTIRYNNILVTDGGGGIVIFNPASNKTRNLAIYGNVVRSQSGAVEDFNGCITLVSGADTNLTADIYNNTVIAESGRTRGLYIGARTGATVNVRNNIAYSNDAQWALHTSMALNQHINNLYYKTGATYTNDWVYDDGPSYADSATVKGWEATCQAGDPEFTTNFTNLILQAGSIAIDSATTIASYTEDIDGNTVPTGTAPDIGAYEKQGMGFMFLLILGLFIGTRWSRKIT